MTDLDPYAPPPEHTDRWREEQYVSPENACIECGQQGSLYCGCCGFPLCGKHHEVGGGFCSNHHHVGGVSVCVYRTEVFLGTFPCEERVLQTRGVTAEYHLPDTDDASAAACQPDYPDVVVSLTLAAARDGDLRLCPDCATEARHRYALFQQELREEWGDRDGE